MDHRKNFREWIGILKCAVDNVAQKVNYKVPTKEERIIRPRKIAGKFHNATKIQSRFLGAEGAKGGRPSGGIDLSIRTLSNLVILAVVNQSKNVGWTIHKSMRISNELNNFMRKRSYCEIFIATVVELLSYHPDFNPTESVEHYVEGESALAKRSRTFHSFNNSAWGMSLGLGCDEDAEKVHSEHAWPSCSRCCG